MKKIATTLFLSLTFLSCDKAQVFSVSYREKSCIKEINRSYASLDESPKSIYKLEQIVKDDEPKLKVSVWHNHSWYYQGKMKYTYFDDTELFKYEETNCPDGSDRRKGITDRLKTIDL